MRKLTTACAVMAALALVVAACGSETSTSPGAGGSTSAATTSIADLKGEGSLDLIAWQGYTEDDWVKPFEQDTGCNVTIKYANTSDDMVNYMRQGGGTLYDGVSASGDATNRLIANGDVTSIDISQFPQYANVMQSLQAPAHNTVDGVHYGVPYMWGPNFLMYNTDVVKPAPTSWDVTFDPSSPYAGKITAYDSPIFIADAALYLKTHQPDLGITDPYELTSDQLDAATSLLKQQAGMIGKYWAYYLDEIKGFNSGDMVIGTAWPVNEQYVQAAGKVTVADVIPSEGVTGWADTWMMSSHAQHPNCMLKWMDYSLQPDVQTQVAEFYGATPSNTGSCTKLNKDLGDAAAAYHCGDDQFLQSVYLWKTPLGVCPDGSQTCTDYNAWTEKWLEIRGGGG
ncbi:MAG: ABC transporter substrate-binding protein [Actinomycetota bacterium]|nr:ABC transporter substrate-binding protein [Actinomycetota bacterium]